MYAIQICLGLFAFAAFANRQERLGLAYVRIGASVTVSLFLNEALELVDAIGFLLIG